MTGQSASPERVRVIAAVVRRGDRYLVCQRPSHKRHGGLFEFPGGKCLPGESDAEAVTRELYEELGVAVTHVNTAAHEIADAGSQFIIAFVPVSIEGEPTAHEHSALVWATLDEIAGLPLAPSDREFAEGARRGCP